MKKHTTKNKRVAADKAEFKTRMAELAARVKAIKAKLQDALKDAKALSKDAFALRQFGNRNLFIKDEYGISPAFARLLDDIGTLNRWEDIKFGVNGVIADCWGNR